MKWCEICKPLAPNMAELHSGIKVIGKNLINIKFHATGNSEDIFTFHCILLKNMSFGLSMLIIYHCVMNSIRICAKGFISMFLDTNGFL